MVDAGLVVINDVRFTFDARVRPTMATTCPPIFCGDLVINIGTIVIFGGVFIDEIGILFDGSICFVGVLGAVIIRCGDRTPHCEMVIAFVGVVCRWDNAVTLPESPMLNPVGETVFPKAGTACGWLVSGFLVIITLVTTWPGLLLDMRTIGGHFPGTWPRLDIALVGTTCCGCLAKNTCESVCRLINTGFAFDVPLHVAAISCCGFAPILIIPGLTDVAGPSPAPRPRSRSKPPWSGSKLDSCVAPAIVVNCAVMSFTGVLVCSTSFLTASCGDDSCSCPRFGVAATIGNWRSEPASPPPPIWVCVLVAEIKTISYKWPTCKQRRQTNSTITTHCC